MSILLYGTTDFPSYARLFESRAGKPLGNLSLLTAEVLMLRPAAA